MGCAMSGYNLLADFAGKCHNSVAEARQRQTSKGISVLTSLTEKVTQY